MFIDIRRRFSGFGTSLCGQTKDVVFIPGLLRSFRGMGFVDSLSGFSGFMSRETDKGIMAFLWSNFAQLI